MQPTIAARITSALRRSALSIDELVAKTGASRGAVKVNLHRLDAKGLLVKVPPRYRLRKGAQKI